MKTLVKNLIIVVVLILTSTSAFSNSKKDTRRTNEIPAEGITYVVNIDLSDAGSLCYTYIVVIKDENGDPVGASWVFMEGIDTYVFHEDGPVSGTRSAHLERITSNHTCSNIYYTAPDYKLGNFRNGRTYIFELFPSDVPNNN